MAVHADAAEHELEEAKPEPQVDERLEEPTETDSLEHDDSWTLATPRTGRRVLGASLTIVAALSGLLGWLGYQGYQSHRLDMRHAIVLQTARQAALNLTTIDCTEVEANVQRIIDSATGTFREDFKKRSQPFIDVVKQSQSKSQGSVTEAAVESEQHDSAQVLVAVTVNTSIAGVAEEQPRAWRMRITVQRVGEDTKVSSVEFVP